MRTRKLCKQGNHVPGNESPWKHISLLIPYSIVLLSQASICVDDAKKKKEEDRKEGRAVDEKIFSWI